MFSYELQGANQILIVGKNVIENMAFLENLEYQITKLYNIQSVYRISTNKDITKLKTIWEKQQKKNANPILLYFENCVCNDLYDSIINDSYFCKIICNGRHCNIYSILIMEPLFHLSPELRTNIDVVFVDKNINGCFLSDLHTSYFGFIPTLKAFKTFIESFNTEQYIYFNKLLQE